MKYVSLERYKEFVAEVTSEESNDVEALIARLRELNKDVNIALLLTGSEGLASEGGEFGEIVKKALFQGKRFVLRSQVLGEAHKAFMAAGVALPPTLRETA